MKLYYHFLFQKACSFDYTSKLRLMFPDIYLIISSNVYVMRVCVIQKCAISFLVSPYYFCILFSLSCKIPFSFYFCFYIGLTDMKQPRNIYINTLHFIKLKKLMIFFGCSIVIENTVSQICCKKI